MILRWNYPPAKPKNLKPVFTFIVKEQREQTAEKEVEAVAVISVHKFNFQYSTTNFQVKSEIQNT